MVLLIKTIVTLFHSGCRVDLNPFLFASLAKWNIRIILSTTWGKDIQEKN